MVDGERVHGGRRRRARRDLRHRGTELDARRMRADPAQRREAVRTPGFRGPHRIEPQALCLLRQLDETRRWSRRPVAELQSQLELLHMVTPPSIETIEPVM